MATILIAIIVVSALTLGLNIFILIRMYQSRKIAGRILRRLDKR